MPGRCDQDRFPRPGFPLTFLRNPPSAPWLTVQTMAAAGSGANQGMTSPPGAD
jgi:hypothetical protein